MLILDGSTDKLQVVLSGAAATTEPSWQASWAQLASTDLESYDTLEGATNGATAVDLVVGVLGKQLLVKSVTVCNRDTAPVTVDIIKDISATDYIIFHAVLAVGQILEYEDCRGWVVHGGSGNASSTPVVSWRELKSYTIAGTYNWVRPTGFVPRMVTVVCVGGGGGGGGGESSARGVLRYGGAGGGGGCYSFRSFTAADLATSVEVIVGVGGAGGAGAADGGNGTIGTDGGSSSFGGTLLFGGGGGGGGPGDGLSYAGGSGGGTGGDGAASGVSTLGGSPTVSIPTLSFWSGQGGHSLATGAPDDTEFGGAAGAGHQSAQRNAASSQFGGSGGGAGASASAANAVSAATPGNLSGYLRYTEPPAIAGGAAGTSSNAYRTNSPGLAGDSNYSLLSGSGGGGGGSCSLADSPGTNGGDGGYPAGGGGGGGAATSVGTGGDGGTGGAGMVLVFCW